MTTIPNPFHAPFTMERIRSPDQFFRYFSPTVFARVGRELGRPRSHFVVGPNGCGKTTCLRFLHYRYQRYLSSQSSPNEFQDALGGLPKRFAAIYYTVRKGPISGFFGKGVDPRHWARLYANYLNLVLTEEILRFLDWCLQDDNWDWSTSHRFEIPPIRALAKHGFEELLSDAARECGASSLADTLNASHTAQMPQHSRNVQRDQAGSIKRTYTAVVAHLNTYHRFLSHIRPSVAELPNDTILPGTLVGNLAQV